MHFYQEISEDTFARWLGPRLPDGRGISPKALERWPDADLAAVDLYKPAAAADTPEGQRVVSLSVQRVEGVVRYVNVLEDIPPSPLPNLEPYQFFSMLKISGKEAQLNALIDTLPEYEKTIVRAKLERTREFRPDNDVVQMAKSGLGLSDEDFKELWLSAYAIK